jgi:hypothetical protein
MKGEKNRRQLVLPHMCGLPHCICVCYLTNPPRGYEPVGTLWLTLSFRPTISDQAG